ncbi:MAG TPA: hypothetical protein VMD30_06905 [Tepidisphaeraceae bacterium]|nr:hypothetical protein [Tepidisphaeraceae bacterium]
MGATAAIFAICPATHASVITFAQFQEDVPNGGNANLFSYSESGVAGSGGSATLTAISVPVTFTYQSIAGLPADLQGPQAATLTLTTATTLAYTTEFSGAYAGEIMDDPESVLTITRDTPAAEGAGSMTDLLTVDFSDAGLSGFVGDHNPDLVDSAPDMAYSSDFLNLDNADTVEDLNLAFTSWNSADGGGLELDTTSGFFNSATAAAAGTFDISLAPTTVPEPASMSLVALSALPLLARRKRRVAR